MISQS